MTKYIAVLAFALAVSACGNTNDGYVGSENNGTRFVGDWAFTGNYCQKGSDGADYCESKVAPTECASTQVIGQFNIYRDKTQIIVNDGRTTTTYPMTYNNYDVTFNGQTLHFNDGKWGQYLMITYPSGCKARYE